jgi:hypothetical protein
LQGQIAAGGAERQNRRSGVEVVERLLFDRVDTKTRRTAVGGQYHLSADVLANETRAALAVMQLAVARTEVALDPLVGDRVPPATGVG